MLSTLIAFALTLGIVIIIHELGHFAVCKWTGIYVKTFSIGFGPKLLRRRYGETEYVISVAPFGGYVKMAGEGVLEEIQDTATRDAHHYPIGTIEGDRAAALRDDPIPESRHFRNRPAWQRLAVVTAGPAANLLLALILYTLTVLGSGLLVIPVTTVGGVADGSPAAAAGLQAGDRILEVDGKGVATWDELTAALLTAGESAGGTAALTYERDGARATVSLQPRRDAAGRWELGMEPHDNVVGLVQKGGPAGRAGLQSGDRVVALDGRPVASFNDIARVINAKAGVPVSVRWERGGETFERAIVPTAEEVQPDSTIGRIFFERRYESRHVGLFHAVRIGVAATVGTIASTVEVLGNFFLGRLGMEAVGGPIRIGQVAGEMLRWSFSHLMQFIAFFSVNLFLLNLLPIPVLDGGHVVFILLEMVMGRRVHERVQAIATQVGLIMLLLFMTFVIVVDVLKILPGQ